MMDKAKKENIYEREKEKETEEKKEKEKKIYSSDGGTTSESESSNNRYIQIFTLYNNCMIEHTATIAQ